MRVTEIHPARGGVPCADPALWTPHENEHTIPIWAGPRTEGEAIECPSKPASGTLKPSCPELPMLLRVNTTSPGLLLTVAAPVALTARPLARTTASEGAASATERITAANRGTQTRMMAASDREQREWRDASYRGLRGRPPLLTRA